ncbi:excalibur calcium-binding domain-containing protein [Exiguobacterium sp. s127]|uniref:excalibur calcium-binding domain-containing protein n=1 Tax=Exiguobacterium sp. s127 TaxID=2751210 RepID=UPI0025541431|nr:excalibur calcium-binding domain-containing protein [Exiguobacterium sp. s127]
MDSKEIRRILKSNHPEGYITSGQYRSNSYSVPYYVVATAKEGLFFYVNKRGSLDMELHLSWAAVPNTLYLRKDKNDKTYRTKKELLLTIFVGDKEGKMVAELIEGRRKLLPWTKFPWYRKIPGYRSQIVWKMVLASMFYFFFLGMFFAAALEDVEDDTKQAVKQPVVQTEAETEPKKSDSEAAKKKKAEELAAAKKAKAAEEKKKAALEKKKAEQEKKKLAQEKAKAEAKREAERKAKIAAQEKAKKEAAAKLAAQQEAEKKAEEAAQKAEQVAVATTQVSFDNCDDLRTEYPNGVPSSHPAYEAKMDRDKDNFACERN